jgi:tRNA(fMet)-specific endonuclease VapC
VTYLLDTNAFVDHLRRGPASKVTAKLLATPPGCVYLCFVVLGELIFGAIRSGPLYETANRAKITGLQALFSTIPFDDDAAEEYGRLRAHLSVSGSLKDSASGRSSKTNSHGAGAAPDPMRIEPACSHHF